MATRGSCQARCTRRQDAIKVILVTSFMHYLVKPPGTQGLSALCEQTQNIHEFQEFSSLLSRSCQSPFTYCRSLYSVLFSFEVVMFLGSFSYSCRTYTSCLEL